jgi:acetamidase/formamidase
MDVILRLTVRGDFSIAAPQFHLRAGAEVEDARTSFHVCTGVGPDLMEASCDAVRATIAHLGDRYGLEREEAYAVASVAADLRIHEVVDAPNWVVGAFIPEAIFEGGR